MSITRPTATPELPLGAAAAADGGRTTPSSAAAVRNVIAFQARPARPTRIRLAGEVMLLPVLPRWPIDLVFTDGGRDE